MLVQERRGATRHPFFAAAEITEPATSYAAVARTNELSRTGCYLDMLSPVSAGLVLEVRIIHAGQAFEIPARVVHSEQNVGMGLCFDAAESGKLDLLDLWLAGIGT